MKLHEVYLLLEKYRKEFVDKLIIKYKEEVGESFNENEALENINFFDKYNEKLPKEKRNLQEYTYKDLVDAVNSIKSNTKVKKEIEVDFLDTKLIYQNNSLKIYSGDSEKACVAIRGEYKTTWCIATPQNNQYNIHRYGDEEPSFYFIKNLDRLNKIQELEEDPFAFFIITKNKNNEFIVTNSLNDGENTKSWEEILEIEPLLNGKEDLFKHKPLSGEEKENYNKFKDAISDEEYKDLSYKEKQLYISIYKKLTNEQFKVTPKDLINDYITTGVELTKEQFNFIKDKQSLFNNYRRVTIDNVIPQYLKGTIRNFGNRWSVLTDDEAIDIYNKKEVNFPEILQYKPKLIGKFENVLYKLNNNNITGILEKQPQLIGNFEDKLSGLTTNNISSIISNQPQLFEKFKLDELDGFDISTILQKQPQLIVKFENDLNKLNKFNIKDILTKQPQLIVKFENLLNKLNMFDINEILIKQPQLKPYFDKIKPINENKKLKLLNFI